MHIHIYSGDSKVTNPITIYTNPLTANGIKMSLITKALNIDTNFISVALNQGQQRSNRFLDLNPNGSIPVLVDEEFVLSESNAILIYLTQKYCSQLLPKSFKTQLKVMQWLFWQSSNWSKVAGVFAHRRLIMPFWGLTKNSEIPHKKINEFHQQAKILDTNLSQTPFLVEDKASIADISIASFLILSEPAEIPLQDFKNIQRWLANLQHKSWWQATQSDLCTLLNL